MVDDDGDLVDDVDEDGGQEVDQQDAHGAPAQLRRHLRHCFATERKHQ